MSTIEIELHTGFYCKSDNVIIQYGVTVATGLYAVFLKSLPIGEDVVFKQMSMQIRLL